MLLKKIKFLVKSKAPLEVILVFFIEKIKSVLIKNRKKKFKKENQNFLKEKKITSDYFSSNSFYFFDTLKELKKINYLEIGAFEGNSSMFVARKFNLSQVYCVDNWEGIEEYYNLDFNKIEENFNENIKEFKNIIKLKKTSDDFFMDNKIKFDVIYIDGYHKASQVIKDFKNSWNCLLPNGILIFDDYIWQFFKNIEDNPCFAVNTFLKSIKNQYKILIVSNSQLFIKKI